MWVLTMRLFFDVIYGGGGKTIGWILESFEDALPKARLKHFFPFILLYLFLGGFFSFFVAGVPLGNYWWDYLALKGLEMQMFSSTEAHDQLWLPFVLPIYLFSWANKLSGFAVDYFVAHIIIGLMTFLFSYKAVFQRLSVRLALLVYGLLFLFSVFPVVLDGTTFKSFTDANAVAYHGFYNRYLDVIFCLLVASFWTSERKVDRWVVIFWSYALLVSLLSKFSYFLVFYAMIWGGGVFRQRHANFGLCLFVFFLSLGLYFVWPNYFDTVFSIAAVRNIPVSAYSALILVCTGFLVSVWIYRQSKDFRTGMASLMVLLGAVVLAIGNNGDLEPIRYVFAIGFALGNAWKFWDGLSFNLVLKGPRGNVFCWDIGVGSIFVFLAFVILLKPVAVVAKTGVVTSTAIVAYNFRLDEKFIEYKYFSSFFSHPYFLTKRSRVDSGSSSKEGQFYKHGKKHTIAYFTLYLQEMEDALDYLDSYHDEKIAWISFPGLVPQLVGIGDIPEGVRPWYLYAAEIDEDYHPDFSKINQDSMITVVDDCNWGRGDKLMKKFGGQILDDGSLVYKNKCFSVYKNANHAVAYAAPQIRPKVNRK